MEKEKIINIIKDELGFKLYDWQIKYIFENSNEIPTGRKVGKTTAYILRLILSDGEPIDLEDEKTMIYIIKSVLSNFESVNDKDKKALENLHNNYFEPNYYQFFVDGLHFIYRKLIKCGIKVRPIHFGKYEKHDNLTFNGPNRSPLTNSELELLEDVYSRNAESNRESISWSKVVQQSFENVGQSSDSDIYKICKPKENLTESFTITFDISKGDIPTLTIWDNRDGTIKALNTITGESVKVFYEVLTNRNLKEEPKND